MEGLSWLLGFGVLFYVMMRVLWPPGRRPDWARTNMRVKFGIIAIVITGLVPLGAQAQGRQFPKPSPGLMPNPAVGKTLYEANCAKCHGGDLRGTKEGPPLLHPYYKPSHHADIAFQIAAKFGVRQHHWNFGDMAPLKDVTPDDVAHIIAYVRLEQRKAGLIK